LYIVNINNILKVWGRGTPSLQ